MKEVDFLVVGAGPAALGALIGIAKARNASVLQMSGADGARMGAGAWIDGGLARPEVAGELGLPQVRALGIGGTTNLWHAGLFVPDRNDAIVSACDGIATGADLIPHLAGVVKATADQPGTLFKALGDVVARAAARSRQETTCTRQVFVPRIRSVLSAETFKVAAKPIHNYSMSPGVVVDVVESNGRFSVLTAGAGGFSTVSAKSVVLAAGVLGSGLLMRRLQQRESLSFSDHYHVFAGALPSAAVFKTLPVREWSGTGSFQTGLKFSVRLDDGELADVMFTFRRVSNPDFPRAGRRFGKFVGINALSRLDKLKLLAGSPLTAVEMLAFLWGVELPLHHALVHATVSLSGKRGRITALGIEPNIPRAKVAQAVSKAWEPLCAALAIPERDAKQFANEQLHDSAISGAQFVGSLSDAKMDAGGSFGNVVIADCSRFSFTSVYNQGLVSFAAGYSAVASTLRS